MLCNYLNKNIAMSFFGTEFKRYLNKANNTQLSIKHLIVATNNCIFNNIRQAK